MSSSLEDAHIHHVNPGANGMLSAVIVSRGQVIGTWKRALKKDSVMVTPKFFRKPTSEEKKRFELAAGTYGTFLGKEGKVLF